MRMSYRKNGGLLIAAIVASTFLASCDTSTPAAQVIPDGTPSAGRNAATQTNSRLRLITRTAIGLPVAGAGDHVFWLDPDGSKLVHGSYQHLAIYGYDLATDSQFVAAKDVGKSEVQFVTDGNIVVWRQYNDPSPEPFWIFDPKTGQRWRLFADSLRPLPVIYKILSIEDGTIYYSGPGRCCLHNGLYAISVNTGQFRFIGNVDGSDIKVKSGNIAWVTQTYCGQYCQGENLSLASVDGKLGDTIVAGAETEFLSGFDLKSNILVYSFTSSDDKVYQYNIQDGSKEQLSDGTGLYPVIGDGEVAWTREVIYYPSYTHTDSIEIRHLDGGIGSTHVVISPAINVNMEPIAITDDGTLVFTVNQKPYILTSIYAINLNNSSVAIPTPVCSAYDCGPLTDKSKTCNTLRTSPSPERSAL